MRRYLIHYNDVVMAIIMVAMGAMGMQVAESLSNFLMMTALVGGGFFFIGYGLVERTTGHRNLATYKNKTGQQ